MFISRSLGIAILTVIIILFIRREYIRRRKLAGDPLRNLYLALKVKRPLRLNDWTIQPDFAERLVSEIIAQKPNCILEAGCGVSTLLAAYALRRNNKGKIISLEHQEKYAGASRREIQRRRLANYATVLSAPLQDYQIADRVWKWYTLEEVSAEKIDMLLVDGPPGSTQEMARYPIVPLVKERLSPRVVIILDDTLRGDEQKIIAAWLAEFPGFQAETVSTMKGMAILRRGFLAETGGNDGLP